MNQKDSNGIFYNSVGHVPEHIIEELIKISELKKVGLGVQLVKENEIPTKVYMLVSGVIRCYLSTESGKEFNKSFYLPNSLFGSLTALIKKQPSLFVFETLSECKVYEVDFYKIKHLCENNIISNSLYSRVLESIYAMYEKRLVELISLDAKSRYLELRKQIPDVDTIIPQYHIASFLGITPVQLSRIRKKIDSD